METIARIAKFKRALLSTFAFITAPVSKVELEVLYNVSESNLITDEDTGRQRYIVSLKAIAPDKIDAVKQVFAHQEEVEIEKTNGLFLTANIFKNGEKTPHLPMRGEKVNCSIDYVQDREGKQVLRVTGISLRPAETAAKLDINALFGQPSGQTQEQTHATSQRELAQRS